MHRIDRASKMLDRIELISLTLLWPMGMVKPASMMEVFRLGFLSTSEMAVSKNRMKIFVSSYREQNHEIEDSVG